MEKIRIGNDLLSLCPKIQLGCIQYTADVEKGSKELWKEITDTINKIKTNMTLADIPQEKNISDSRELYRKIGKDPHRYRISSEALLRRILQKYVGAKNIDIDISKGDNSKFER